MEEAVRALVDASVSAPADAVMETIPIRLERDGDEEALVLLLEEVIYAMDVLGTIPTGLTLSEEPDGGISGSMDLASPDVVEVHGSLPKGISLAGSVVRPAWRSMDVPRDDRCVINP